MKLAAAATLALLAVAPTLGAQTTPAPLRVDIPVFDAPYNVGAGLRGPSMAQSLAIGETYYEVAHAAIQRAWGKHTKLANTSLVLFSYFGGLLPGGEGWVHEEFHRAVMGNRGISSFNDIYKLDLGAETVAVSHVDDDALVRLKATHPLDQIRLGVAGIEGENLLVGRLEKNRFFYGSRANNVPMYWMSKLNSAFYVASGAMAETDTMTDQMNASDGANIPVRDFTGHDFTAWVYDLHRPAEPYSARGVHPSGTGIDRYIATRDLSAEERRYLRNEGRLQLINFIDPNLLGIDGVTIGETRVNLTASHLLTSFGHTIDVNLFMMREDMRLLVAARRYSNGARTFPGVDVQLLDLPVTVGAAALEVSPRVALWMQPEGQAFRTTESFAGGLASLKVRPATTSRLSTFVELEAKTAGWVAGNVKLGRSAGVRLGGSLRLQ